MNVQRFVFILLFCIILISISSISANEDVDLILEGNYNQFDLNKNSDGDLSLQTELDESSIFADDESKDCEIYIGSNENDGNGSKENPYKNFDLAHANIKDKNNVTIKVEDGTYELGSVLKFNCTNLHIQGIGNNVIIKNKYNTKGTNSVDGSKQSFGLTSLDGTFLMSNIIVDASGWTQSNSIQSNAKRTTYFYLFYNELGNNNAIFKNCTFKEYYRMLPPTIYNNNLVHNITFSFIQCNFEYNSKSYTTFFGTALKANFKYCLFNLNLGNGGSLNEYARNYTFNSCWFGQNTLPNYLFYQDQAQSNYGEYIGMKIDKYAVFSISEEKIDDNTYDIIGKLMWNDSTTDGIENLAPMTVTLTSATGEIPATATLENGTFKVRYTTQSKEHNITAKLDSQELNLAFNYNVDMNAEAKPIYYGEDQNITINLPYNATGLIKLVFEDETSEELEITDVSSFNYTIKKTLKAGTNKINISLIDNNAHSYGSTVLNYEVLKINEYKFDVNAPENVTIGDNITVTVELPEDAKGNVTIFIGKNNFTKEVNGNIVKIDVNGFKVGENEIKINYTGDDVYDKKSLNKIITAKKVETKVNETTLVDETPANSDKPTFTINLHEDATGNFTVTINGKNYTKELINGSATIVIEDLPKGEYNATLTYSGDDKYDRIIKNTTVSVKEVTKQSSSSNKDTSITSNKVVKKATKITAKKKTFKAKLKVKKYTITLKAGKKPIKKVKVTIKIGKKTYSAKTNAKGKATFKIKKLTKKGKYTAVIKFKGNKNYKPTSKKVKITIKK